MNRRILYPGSLLATEVILVTGAVHGVQLSLAAKALSEGVRARGKTVSIAAPGAVRAHSQAQQFGNPQDWDTDVDVLLVEFGEYLGETRFRHGELGELAFTRTVFFTPVAEPSVAHSVTLPWEEDRRRQVSIYLEAFLPGPVHLCRPSLLRPSGSEQMLQETNNEVVGYLEQGRSLPDTLARQRTDWRGHGGLDRVPRLERALW